MFVIYLLIGYPPIWIWCYLWLSTPPKKTTKVSKDGVLVYDFLDSKWRSPETTAGTAGTGAGPGRRQGHSATALQRQLCVYGGGEMPAMGHPMESMESMEFMAVLDSNLVVMGKLKYRC